MANTAVAVYLRRLADRLVQALRYTGDNTDGVLALGGGAFRAEAWPDHLILAREHPPGRGGVRPRDWVINDGQLADAFRAHCREVPIE